MPFATQAAMLGGNLGVGMEDSLFIGPGELTRPTLRRCTRSAASWRHSATDRHTHAGPRKTRREGTGPCHLLKSTEVQHVAAMGGGLIGRTGPHSSWPPADPASCPCRVALRCGVVAALRPADRGDVVLHHRRQHLHPYSHTVRAAADDARRVFLAHEPNSPDLAASAGHLAARLGEQYGPQFVQDVAAKLLVELAEATAAIATQNNHEGIHAQAFVTGLVPD